MLCWSSEHSPPPLSLSLRGGEQTAEHRDLILTMFDRLTSLQQLVLDRFSWFNSLAHYVAGVVLVYLLTSTARTAGAR